MLRLAWAGTFQHSPSRRVRRLKTTLMTATQTQGPPGPTPGGSRTPPSLGRVAWPPPPQRAPIPGPRPPAPLGASQQGGQNHVSLREETTPNCGVKNTKPKKKRGREENGFPACWVSRVRLRRRGSVQGRASGQGPPSSKGGESAASRGQRGREPPWRGPASRVTAEMHPEGRGPCPTWRAPGEWGGPCPGLPGHQLLRTQPWAEAAPSPSSARRRRRQFQPGCRPHRRRQARDAGPVPVPVRAGGRGPGRCWRQACAKCRLPGQQRDRGSGAGVGRGSEVSAPRKRPPAGPPGHRERAAEALS